MKRSTILKTILPLLAIVLIAVIGLKFTQSVSAAFNGAIFTTKGDGTTVDANIYENKADVYLNGGPQNQNAAGLPDGVYYFQVTTPNGALLLSEDDAVCRQLYVVGGAVGGVLPRVSDAVPSNLPNVAPYTDRRPDTCPAHANGTFVPANNSTPVQLIPFSDTTNAGGEYKVWLIRRATNTTVNGRVITFNNSNAKTDNFKIRPAVVCIPGEDPECSPTITLSGHKFYDANVNSLDDDNQVVPGVQIKITITLPGETLPLDPIIVETDEFGNWELTGVANGSSYVVEEIPIPGCDVNTYWVETAPVADGNGFQGYRGTANNNVTGLDFGNVCFRPGTGGLTLGFWSNKNGKRTMDSTNPNNVDVNTYPTPADNPTFPANSPGMTGDLAFLSRLNLKGEAVNRKVVFTLDFDPATYESFNAWILSANAYNMSYMLSAQLAATSLDVRHKQLSDSTIVDARGVCNSVGSCLGFITIGEVRRLANQSLGAAGGNTTISGDPLRESQELMKNFLDDVNNNRLFFANSTPCGVCYLPPQ